MDVQKTIDQAQEEGVEKTPEKAVMSGVISGQPNQEVHENAFKRSHAHDKTLSEPDMIAMNGNETLEEYNARVAQIQSNRFGFYDSEGDGQEKNKARVTEHPAKQAVKMMPGLSPTLGQPPYDSMVKANVQITNVPEVTEAVTYEVLAKYANTVLENAAQAVRQVENHLAQPNAINGDFLTIGQMAAKVPGHFAQSPDQLNNDARTILDNATAQIDKPLEPEDRAKLAGMLFPMFFFEGGNEPINPETIEQLGLGEMTETELKALGIEKRAADLEEGVIGKRRMSEEKDIVNPIDRNATAEEKLAQLQALSTENEPLVQKFLQTVDTKFGTTSEVGVKSPQDILNKAKRPSILENKEWFDVDHIRDSLRFRTPVESLGDLPKILEELADSGFTVVKADVEKLLAPKDRGWRVAAIDLRAPNGQLIEYQILPREMYEAGKTEHHLYKTVREKDVKTLSRDQKIEVRELNIQARNLYSDAWQAYLRRTGQTEESVRKIVKEAKDALMR